MPDIKFPLATPVPVVPQPKGNVGWVSPDLKALTKFKWAQDTYNTPAFIAHSGGAGKYLQGLNIGDVITYLENMQPKNGTLSDIFSKGYKVKEIHRYQTMQPRNMRSPQKSLEDGNTYSSEAVTDKIYKNRKGIVFQTCIEKGSNPAWGRMFVIAE
jgi:hypothetical protein